MKNENSGSHKRIRRLYRLLAAGGSALSILALVASVLGGLFIVRVYRHMNMMQKTMPVVKKAAQLYLEQNGQTASGRGKGRGKKNAPKA